MQTWKFEPARDLGLSFSERLRSPWREGGLGQCVIHWGWTRLADVYLSLLHRLEVRGSEHLPLAAPFVLAANHSSHLDTLVLASALPSRLRARTHPLAAEDTFFITPVRAALSGWLLNALPLRRHALDLAAVQHLRARLRDDPCGYIVYPEGTRSRDGAMMPFKPGIGAIVAESAVPVVPCHIAGAFTALPPGHCWPAFHAITLAIGEPLVFAATPNNPPAWKAIARELETHVRRLSGKGQAQFSKNRNPP